MFVNYFQHPDKENAVILAIVRILLSVYAIWKLLSYSWGELATWPSFLFRSNTWFSLYYGPWQIELLEIQVWITVGLLICVLFGYRMAITGFMCSLSLAVLSGLHYSVTNQGSTFTMAVYLLLLFALYRHEDTISVDGLRRMKQWSLEEMNVRLQGESDQACSSRLLRTTLILFAGTYFLTGYHKITAGPIEWIQGENIGRFILATSEAHIGGTNALAEFVLSNPALLDTMGVLTLSLEMGFLIAVIMGVPLWIFALGLLGMHTGIALTMQIFFFDQYILFALFLPWRSVFARQEASKPLRVVYDEQNRNHMSWLVAVSRLDVSDVIEFTPLQDLPGNCCVSREERSEAMPIAIDDEDIHTGYDGFLRILTQFSIFRPLAWLLDSDLCRGEP